MNKDCPDSDLRQPPDLKAVPIVDLNAGWQPSTVEIRGYRPRATGKPEGKNPPRMVSSVVPAPQNAVPKEKG